MTLPDSGGESGGGGGEDDDFLGVSPSYVVPFISGQGLNNQLWEYRGAATLARALNRTVCLEPAHRFYLTTTGREFIPFDELFDVSSIQRHVSAVLGGGHCAVACGGKIHRMLNLVGKPTPPPKNPYTIADWRPGSLIKFGGSTGFRHVPSPTNHLVSRDDPPMENLAELARKIGPVARGARCLGLQGNAGLEQVGNGDEKRRWTEVLQTSPKLIEGARRVHEDLMNGEPYLAIHWRFEETKCAGYGVGIGNGRDAGEMNRKGTATKGDGDLCFFAGVVPKQTPVKIWLRLVSKEQVTATVKRVMAEHGLKHVFLATDGKDKDLIGWVKRETGAKTLDDLPAGWDAVSLADNDIASRLEQQLCQDSKIFMGTQGSSWTLAVIEDRFKRQGKMYVPQDKFSSSLPTRPSDDSMFFDMEVCDCEWTDADTVKARKTVWKER